MILDGFDDLEDLKKQYAIDDEELEGYTVLLACYESGAWDGSSIIILQKEDKLFIIDAGHCSCYGLEGQFYPIETTKELLHREANARENHYPEYTRFIKFVREEL